VIASSTSAAHPPRSTVVRVRSKNYSIVTGNLSRLDYTGCREALRRRLAEPAPGRIQLVTGPRQVGKTTLLLALAAELGERATYIAADGPEAALPGFWERLWNRVEETAASRGGTNVVLIDEVQHLADWAARLKAEWDRLRRRRLPVHVVATGSSALRLARGSKESLAGRFERLTLAHWSASALAQTFGLLPDDAAELVVRMGAYPGAIELRNDTPRWAAYVRDAIVEPAIGRDILALAPVRRPALLRQVFAVAAASPAQIVSLQKLRDGSRIGRARDHRPLPSPARGVRRGPAREAREPPGATARRAAQARDAQQRAHRRGRPARHPGCGARTGAIRRLGGERLPRVRMEFGLPRGVLARGAAGGRRGHRRQPGLVGHRGEDRAFRRRRRPRAARVHQAFPTVPASPTLRPFRAAGRRRSGCRPC
jgi:hypothetical protein